MVFYFSGTGNTRWAAQLMAAATGEELVCISDLPQHSPCHFSLQPEERVGFCFPVHGWMPPKIILDFLNRLILEGVEDCYVYALCTCGDDVGMAMDEFNKALEKSCLRRKADSVFSLTMPESYICLPGFNTDSEEKERRKIEKAEKDIAQFISLISDKVKGEDRVFRGVLPWAKTHIVGSFFNWKMITDKPFRVDRDRCLHCGKCAKSCPVANIIMSEGCPTWRRDGTCTNCMLCYHVCPSHCISYWDSKKKGQYVFHK